MKYSIVKYKNVCKDSINFRIDAGYYQNEYNVLLKYLKNAKPLGQFCEISDGDHAKFPENQNKEIPYLRAKDLKENFIDDSELIYVSKNYFQKQKRSHIKAHNILFSIMGSVGSIAITPPNFKPCMANRAIGILKEIKGINPYYVFSYLLSKYATLNIQRLLAGGIQERINLEVIPEIKIPDLNDSFQKTIENIILSRFKYQSKSKNLYKQSEELLLSELDILNWQPKHELSYVKNFSDVNSANRYDAEYFQPKYDEILEIINKNNHTTLIEQFDIIRNSGLEYDSEGKIGVIKTKQLKEHFIDFNVEDRTNQGDSNIIVKNQDVLFASMGVGSLGKANIYYTFEGNDKYIIDSTLKIFRAKIGSKISPEYLDVYLHSQLAQELIYQNIVGSSGIISIYESDLQSLPIPIINKDAEEKIIENVHNAHLFNFQSKQLLEIAKRGVEIAIEENEEVATSWINEQLSKIGVEL